MLTQLDFALLRLLQRKFETLQNSLHFFLNENQFKEFRKEMKEKEE